MNCLIPVSYGDLIDKITILEIKSERIRDEAKRFNIIDELVSLYAVRDSIPCPNEQIKKITDELKQINIEIWEDEERVRLDHGMYEIARTAIRIFQNNDRRHVTKRRINELMISDILEEKSYR